MAAAGGPLLSAGWIEGRGTASRVDSSVSPVGSMLMTHAGYDAAARFSTSSGTYSATSELSTGPRAQQPTATMTRAHTRPFVPTAPLRSAERLSGQSPSSLRAPVGAAVSALADDASAAAVASAAPLGSDGVSSPHVATGSSSATEVATPPAWAAKHQVRTAAPDSASVSTAAPASVAAAPALTALPDAAVSARRAQDASAASVSVRRAQDASAAAVSARRAQDASAAALSALLALTGRLLPAGQPQPSSRASSAVHDEAALARTASDSALHDDSAAAAAADASHVAALADALAVLASTAAPNYQTAGMRPSLVPLASEAADGGPHDGLRSDKVESTASPLPAVPAATECQRDLVPAASDRDAAGSAGSQASMGSTEVALQRLHELARALGRHVASFQTEQSAAPAVASVLPIPTARFSAAVSARIGCADSPPVTEPPATLTAVPGSEAERGNAFGDTRFSEQSSALAARQEGDAEGRDRDAAWGALLSRPATTFASSAEDRKSDDGARCADPPATAGATPVLQPNRPAAQFWSPPLPRDIFATPAAADLRHSREAPRQLHSPLLQR